MLKGTTTVKAKELEIPALIKPCNLMRTGSKWDVK